jgi:prepilin-type processing-associated H-X9-DG protein
MENLNTYVAFYSEYPIFADASYNEIPGTEGAAAAKGGGDRDMQISDDARSVYDDFILEDLLLPVWSAVYPANLLPATGADLAGNGGGDTIYRLREGIERFMITDINNPAGSTMAQSELAIMHDIIFAGQFWLGAEEGFGLDFNHLPGGANVLYMDGHVSFIKYPQPKPPISPVNAQYGW